MHCIETFPPILQFLPLYCNILLFSFFFSSFKRRPSCSRPFPFTQVFLLWSCSSSSTFSLVSVLHFLRRSIHLPIAVFLPSPQTLPADRVALKRMGRCGGEEGREVVRMRGGGRGEGRETRRKLGRQKGPFTLLEAAEGMMQRKGGRERREKCGRREWCGASTSGQFVCPFCDNTEIDLFISAFKILTCNCAISLGIGCRAGTRGGPLRRSHSRRRKQNHRRELEGVLVCHQPQGSHP